MLGKSGSGKSRTDQIHRFYWNPTAVISGLWAKCSRILIWITLVPDAGQGGAFFQSNVLYDLMTVRETEFPLRRHWIKITGRDQQHGTAGAETMLAWAIPSIWCPLNYREACGNGSHCRTLILKPDIILCRWTNYKGLDPITGRARWIALMVAIKINTTSLIISHDTWTVMCVWRATGWWCWWMANAMRWVLMLNCRTCRSKKGQNNFLNNFYDQ